MMARDPASADANGAEPLSLPHARCSDGQAPVVGVPALSDGIGMFCAPTDSPFLQVPVLEPHRREDQQSLAIGCEGCTDLDVIDALRSPWFTGPRAGHFEESFAHLVGAPATLATSSGAAALHLALVTAGVGAGDEVITGPLSVTATPSVIEQLGARSVLADVEPDTLNIDPARVEEAVTGRTRAIVCLHFAGHPAELDSLRQVADAFEVPLIEDATQALTAVYRGHPIGSSSNPCAFSSSPTEGLTSEEGGILTGEPTFIERARAISVQGMTRDGWTRFTDTNSWRYELPHRSPAQTMTEIQAALALDRLRRVAAFRRRRREIVAMYERGFQDCDVLMLPTERVHVESAWHLYVIRLALPALRIGRDTFAEELATRRIGAVVPEMLSHPQPDTFGYRAVSCPIASDAQARLLGLPLDPMLTDRDVADVIHAVLEVANTFRR